MASVYIVYMYDTLLFFFLVLPTKSGVDTLQPMGQICSATYFYMVDNLIFFYIFNLLKNKKSILWPMKIMGINKIYFIGK